ncbi:hypothetical protein M3Y99_01329900 [Aphelenchoides fujianensis]|nr:hypothetical protein M3Y99_01329900 [Aphelenchoides fujianensis]
MSSSSLRALLLVALFFFAFVVCEEETGEDAANKPNGYSVARLPGSYDCTLCSEFCKERRNYCAQFGKRRDQFKCVPLSDEPAMCSCGCFPARTKHSWYQYDKKHGEEATTAAAA